MAADLIDPVPVIRPEHRRLAAEIDATWGVAQQLASSVARDHADFTGHPMVSPADTWDQGGQVLVREFGSTRPDAKTVVLVAGWLSRLSTLEGIAHWLSVDDPKRRVIVAGLPGCHGNPSLRPHNVRETSNWLAGYLQRKGVTSATIGGFSFGGLVAADFAANYPEQTDAVVAINPPLNFRDNPKRGLARALAAASEVRAIRHFILRTTWRRAKDGDLAALEVFNDENLPLPMAVERGRHLERIYHDPLAGDPDLRYLASAGADQASAWQNFASLTVPVAYIRSHSESGFTDADVAELVSRNDRARGYVVKGPHNPGEGGQEQLASVIGDFIRGKGQPDPKVVVLKDSPLNTEAGRYVRAAVRRLLSISGRHLGENIGWEAATVASYLKAPQRPGSRLENTAGDGLAKAKRAIAELDKMLVEPDPKAARSVNEARNVLRSSVLEQAANGRWLAVDRERMSSSDYRLVVAAAHAGSMAVDRLESHGNGDPLFADLALTSRHLLDAVAIGREPLRVPRPFWHKLVPRGAHKLLGRK